MSKPSNVGKIIVNHPPVITILLGGLTHSQSWVVYGIVLPTLFIYIYIYKEVHSFEPIPTLMSRSIMHVSEKGSPT